MLLFYLSTSFYQILTGKITHNIHNMTCDNYGQKNSSYGALLSKKILNWWFFNFWNITDCYFSNSLLSKHICAIKKRKVSIYFCKEIPDNWWKNVIGTEKWQHKFLTGTSLNNKVLNFWQNNNLKFQDWTVLQIPDVLTFPIFSWYW